MSNLSNLNLVYKLWHRRKPFNKVLTYIASLTSKKFYSSVLVSISWLVPLLIFPVGEDLFSNSKVTILYIFCLIMLLSLLKNRTLNNIKFTSQLHERALVIYITLCIISSIFVPGWYYALFGRDKRREGLLAILCYIFVFFMASYYYEFKERHLKFLAFSSIIISAIGIIQFMGKDIVLGYTKGSFYLHAYSTIGNRNFVGSFICLMLPLMVLSYMYYKKKVYYFSSCMLFLCMLATLTRSAWISLSIILVIIFIMSLKKLLSLKSFMLISVSFVILFFSFNYISDNQFLGRAKTLYSDMADLNESSGSERVFIWKGSIPVLLEKPILGVGIDNFAEYFSKYNKEGIERAFKNKNVIVDRAHNEFLQITASTGFPSIIAYLVFWIVLFIKSLKRLKLDKILLVMFLCVLAYQIQAFFNISIVGVAPIMWIFAGVLNSRLKQSNIVQTKLS